jgi:hypothetical protein
MSNEKKQSSVEWLRQEWLKRDMDVSIKELFQKAKAMHKEELEMAWFESNKYVPFEDYYNELY